MTPKDYYDADPPEGPDYGDAMEACCGICDDKTTRCQDWPEQCNRLAEWFREQGEEAEARKYDAELEAGERRDDV